MKIMVLLLIVLSACGANEVKAKIDQKKEAVVKTMSEQGWVVVQDYSDQFNDKCILYKKVDGSSTIYWAICEAHSGNQSSIFVK